MNADEQDDDTLPAWSRTFAGWRERFAVPFTLQLKERRLVLEQAPCVSAAHARESKASADGSCTASTVWDAGIVLATHVFANHHNRSPRSSGGQLQLLDLGSGTGIVGLAAAASGGFGRIVLTDLPTVVPLLQRNAAQNDVPAGTVVEVLPLLWDDVHMLERACARGPFDLVVGGDLLYRAQVVAPLLHALRTLVGAHTTVLLTASLQHSPETIHLFAHEAECAGFCVERLGAAAACDEDWYSPEVRMLRLTREAPSAAPQAGSVGEHVGAATQSGPQEAQLPATDVQQTAPAESAAGRKPRKRKRKHAVGESGGNDIRLVPPPAANDLD